MTDHSIEDLENAASDARNELRAAQAKVHKAEKELSIAHLAATGLVGHVVENQRGVRFVVEKQGWWKGRVAGSMVKKDGTLGIRDVEDDPKNLKDHGPYEAPAK